MTLADVQDLTASVDGVFFLIGGALLVFEVIKGLWRRALSWKTAADMMVNVSTQIPSIFVETVILGSVVLGYEFLSQHFVSWGLPVTAWTLVLTLLACDFVYYWEHRLAHEIRLAWTQHAVHHSSRFMNVSVAVRFGPFEGVLSAILHAPLILLGLPTEFVIFGIVAVLAYQTWIHTEAIGRLGVLDGVLNTPSNHRVHHGCDEKYLDKNYGGVLMIWDHLFGTYQREEERPSYGLKRDFNSVNPLVVWFSEIPGLVRDLLAARSLRELGMRLFAHPSWHPEEVRSRKPDTSQRISGSKIESEI
ncbi:MAG: sterol desaturase family protein [Pseudomonadota bacterium]